MLLNRFHLQKGRWVAACSAESATHGTAACVEAQTEACCRRASTQQTCHQGSEAGICGFRLRKPDEQSFSTSKDYLLRQFFSPSVLEDCSLKSRNWLLGQDPYRLFSVQVIGQVIFPAQEFALMKARVRCAAFCRQNQARRCLRPNPYVVFVPSKYYLITFCRFPTLLSYLRYLRRNTHVLSLPMGDLSEGAEMTREETKKTVAVVSGGWSRRA